MMTLDDFMREWESASPFVTAHTSGSTGRPKAIHLRKDDMILSARSTCSFFSIDAASHLHCPLAFDYIAAKMMAVRAVVSGASLTCEPPSARPLAAGDASGHIDLLPVVPYQVDGLMLSPAAGTIGNVIVGGAPLSPDRERMLRDAPFRTFATYGMTETSSHVALRDISAGADTFEALPGFSFSTDGRGCLVIVNDRMSWRSIVTNDVVELFGHDRFRWLSRYDNVINSGGVKVLPEMVEQVAAAMLPADRFYVTSRPDASLGSEVVIVIDESLGLPEQEDGSLLAYLRDRLPRYHAPRAVVRCAISRTASGKIIRRPL